MTGVVALLRGINVGGARRLTMADLRSVMADLGYGDARTYLQSGNVVFHHDADLAEVAHTIEQALASAHGLDVTVLARTAGDLDRIVAGNPWPEETDPALVHVMFLNGEPSPDAVDNLDPDRSPPDRFSVAGREVYLHYPGGSGRSRLTVDWFERQLGVAATARNWRSVTRLAAMVRDLPG